MPRTVRTTFLGVLYQQLPLGLLVVIASTLGGLYIAKTTDPLYRAQTRFFLPIETEAFYLGNEELNVPGGPRIPINDANVLDSLLGTLTANELQLAVAAALPDIDTAYLKSHVKVDIDKYNMMTVTVFDLDAERSARIANTYTREYQNRLLQDDRASFARSLTVVVDSIARLEKVLDDNESEKRQLMAEHDSVDYQTELNSFLSRDASYKDQLAELDVREASVRSDLSAAEAELAARPDWAQTSRSEVENPRIQDMKTQVSSLEVQIADALVSKTAEHPDIQRLELRLEMARKELATLQDEAPKVSGTQIETPDSLRVSLESQQVERRIQLEQIQARRQEVAAQQASLNLRIMAMPAYKARLDELDMKAANNRLELAQLYQRREEFLLHQSREWSHIRIVEVAVTPSEPYIPRTGLILAVASALGLVLAVLLIAFMARVAQYREVQPW